MNFWETFILTVISSGIVGAIVSGVLTHFSNKKMDIQRRTMEIRKDLYTRIINQIALFISTVSEQTSDNARDDLLRYFRELQIWGSDKVMRRFKNLIDLMTSSNSSNEERNLSYKELIVALRTDILGNTNITSEEIDIRGIVK